MTAARSEEPPDREDHRVLGPGLAQAHGGFEHLARPLPPPLDPPRGERRVGDDPVVAVEPRHPRRFGTEERGPGEDGPANAVPEAHGHHRDAQSTAIAVAVHVVRRAGVAVHHHGGAALPAPHGYRQEVRFEHLATRAGGVQHVLHHHVAVDLHRNRSVDAAGHEPAEPDAEHARPAGRQIDGQHAVTIGPVDLLPPHRVGLVEPGLVGHRTDRPGRPPVEATGERPLPRPQLASGPVGEVHDVDPVAGSVAAVAAIRRVDEQVVAGGDVLERFALVDHEDRRPGEVEAQTLPQPGRVDVLVGHEGHLVVSAQHLGHPARVLLPTASGGPVAVVDGDALAGGRRHRTIHHRARSSSGTS